METATIEIQTTTGPVTGHLELRPPLLGIRINKHWYSFEYLNSRWHFMPTTQEWGITFDEAEALKDKPDRGIVELGS